MSHCGPDRGPGSLDGVSRDPIEKGRQLRKLALTGIATIVAAAAVASTAAAELTKPGPGFLGPPVPAPVAPKPGSSTPPGPVKLSPSLGKPSLSSATPIRIPAF